MLEKYEKSEFYKSLDFSNLLDFSNILDFSTLTLTCQIWQDLLDPAKFCQKCLGVKNAIVRIDTHTDTQTEISLSCIYQCPNVKE